MIFAETILCLATACLTPIVTVRNAEGSGSGTIIATSSKGTVIVTAAHVARHAPLDITVTGYGTYSSIVLYQSAEHDLALMMIPDVQVDVAHVATVYAGELDIFQPVILAGVPFGVEPCIFTGRVVTLGRVIQGETYMGIDGVIYPGMSGGAVFVVVDGRPQLAGVPVRGWGAAANLNGSVKPDVLRTFLFAYGYWAPPSPSPCKQTEPLSPLASVLVVVLISFFFTCLTYRVVRRRYAL